MVKIQLETGYLDVKENTVFPLNFGVADIRDVSKRSGIFSKTITLAGTKNNNVLLSNYYDVNIVSGTFDINALTTCAVIQDGIPVLEDCYLQLISVNKKQGTNAHEENVEYEVLIKDAQADFFTKIDNAELTDLDFTELNHTYNSTNVVSSWSNTDGYVYPLGFAPDNVYSLTEFKPAIYAKNYWDKIHADAGFSYTWTTISDCFFDKCVIPFNGDIINIDYSDYLVEERLNGTITYTQTAGTNVTATSSALTGWNEIQDNQALFDPLTGEYDNPFYIGAGQAINCVVYFEYDFNLVNGTGSTAYLVDMDSSLLTRQYRYKVILQVFRDGSLMASQTIPVLPYSRNEGSLPNGTTNIGTYSNTFNIPLSNLTPSEILDFRVKVEVNPTGNIRWKGTNSTGGTDVQIDYEVDVTNLNVRMTPTANVLQFGATIELNNFVPKNIKQKDFIKSICTMFNLFVEPDKDNPNKLIYQHRDDYYDSGAEKDWTLKLAKEREQNLQFLPELTAKKMVLTYKEDSDEPNKLYLESLNEVYGQVEYTFENEYVRDVDKKEIVFSPTPMGSTSFNAIVPMFGGGAPKTNIRILIHNGTATCDPYNIWDYGTTGQNNETTYPLISHFNDHFNPTFDINFGVCDYYFYEGVTLTNNNLFNNYWRRTIGQIDTGKMLTAYFYLTESDIQDLKLNDKIRINNSWWHINRLIDYDANAKTLTKVELMSVDKEIDFAPFINKPSIPLSAPITRRPFKEITRDFIDRNNINLSPEGVTVTGIGNVIGANLRGSFTGQYKSMIESGSYENTKSSVKPVLTTQSTYKLASNVKSAVVGSDYYIVALDGCTTINLTPVVDNIGVDFVVVNRSSSAITIDPDSSETIEGNSTYTLLPNQSACIFSDGTEWRIVSVYSLGAGGVTLGYKAVTTTYTATLIDYLINCTSGTFTVNLPTAVGYTGLSYVVKNSGAGTITVDPFGTQTIEGNATFTLNTGASCTAVSDGTNWIIIAVY